MEPLREISITSRIHRRIIYPSILKDETGHTIIEMPLKERYRTVSFRAPEEAVYAIDKTIVKTQAKSNERVTRTMLIERVIEVLSELFQILNHDVDRIIITCENKSTKTSIAIKLTQVGAREESPYAI